MRRYFFQLGPIVVYYALVTYLSSRSEFPDPFKQFFLFEGQDKVIHAVEYALLGVLIVRPLFTLIRLQGVRLFLWSSVLVLILGGIDETHQSFVAYRESSVFDLFADFVGGVLGMGAWVFYKRFTRRSFKSMSSPRA
jgi:VanZ family protein